MPVTCIDSHFHHILGELRAVPASRGFVDSRLFATDVERWTRTPNDVRCTCSMRRRSARASQKLALGTTGERERPYMRICIRTVHYRRYAGGVDVEVPHCR